MDERTAPEPVRSGPPPETRTPEPGDPGAGRPRRATRPRTRSAGRRPYPRPCGRRPRARRGRARLVRAGRVPRPGRPVHDGRGDHRAGPVHLHQRRVPRHVRVRLRGAARARTARARGRGGLAGHPRAVPAAPERRGRPLRLRSPRRTQGRHDARGRLPLQQSADRHVAGHGRDVPRHQRTGAGRARRGGDRWKSCASAPATTSSRASTTGAMPRTALATPTHDGRWCRRTSLRADGRLRRSRRRSTSATAAPRATRCSARSAG